MAPNGAALILEDGRMHIHDEALARSFLDRYVETLYPQTRDLAIVRSSVPRIGEYWLGQGGIYAGTVRGDKADYHLVLHKDEKESIQWQPALDWTKMLEADGHQDFNLPNRREQAILYGNLKDQFKPEWHWSCEQHASDPHFAWMQNFISGSQDFNRKDGYYRARAVRRLIY